MRIIFMGTPEFAVPVLEAVIAAGAVELAEADEAAVQRWLAERGRELAEGEAATAVAEVEEGGSGRLRSGRRA